MSIKDDKLVIVGAGGHAKNVTSVAVSCGFSLIAYLDDSSYANTLMGKPVISLEECINEFPNVNYVFAIGDNFLRQEKYNKLKSNLTKIKIPTLKDPLAKISLNCNIGIGSILMPGAVIGSNSDLGEMSLMGTNSFLSHDSSLGDFASIAPGVVTGGNVTIGKRSAVMIGSSISHKICIGKDTIIGGSSFVNKNFSDNLLVFGVPAKIIRKRKTGEKYY